MKVLDPTIVTRHPSTVRRQKENDYAFKVVESGRDEDY